MKVRENVRKIIVEWHGTGVPPEETARSLCLPIDEVKAIILQAHPAPAQPKRPEFPEARLPVVDEPHAMRDNRQES